MQQYDQPPPTRPSVPAYESQLASHLQNQHGLNINKVPCQMKYRPDENNRRNFEAKDRLQRQLEQRRAKEELEQQQTSQLSNPTSINQQRKAKKPEKQAGLNK